MDPKGRAASATFNAPKTKLVPPSDRGFMRNDDDGGWHDSQEWVFVDLRTANDLGAARARLRRLLGRVMALAPLPRVRLCAMISAMIGKKLAAGAVLVCAIGACSRNRDKDALKLMDEISSLDRAVTDAVRAAPNAQGLAKAEALVGAKRKNLRDRYVALQDAQLSRDVTRAMEYVPSQNQNSAQNVVDYVKLAVSKSDPALVARANKLADSLCRICKTAAYQCGSFEAHGMPAP